MSASRNFENSWNLKQSTTSKTSRSNSLAHLSVASPLQLFCWIFLAFLSKPTGDASVWLYEKLIHCRYYLLVLSTYSTSHSFIRPDTSTRSNQIRYEKNEKYSRSRLVLPWEDIWWYLLILSTKRAKSTGRMKWTPSSPRPRSRFCGARARGTASAGGTGLQLEGLDFSVLLLST